MVMNVDAARPPPPYMRGLYPWGRYSAKMIDLYLAGLLIGVTAPVVVVALGDAGMLALGAALFPLIEGIMICALGTTPGKALFRISVLREDGSRLGIGQSLHRSYGSWIHGAWLGLPVLGMVAMWTAYKNYSTDRVTKWDLRADARFVARRPNWVGWLGLALVFVLYGWLFYLGAARAANLPA